MTLFYSLNENGDWSIAANIDDATPIRLDTTPSTNVTSTEWNTVQVESKLVPVSGNISVRLFMVTDAGYTQSIN